MFVVSRHVDQAHRFSTLIAMVGLCEGGGCCLFDEAVPHSCCFCPSQMRLTSVNGSSRTANL